VRFISRTSKFCPWATQGAAAAAAASRFNLTFRPRPPSRSGYGDSCSTHAPAACDLPQHTWAAAGGSRPFLFNLVGNMQQRPWRKRLRASILNATLAGAAAAQAAAAAAADLNLTEHVVVLEGGQEEAAIVYEMRALVCTRA